MTLTSFTFEDTSQPDEGAVHPIDRGATRWAAGDRSHHRQLRIATAGSVDDGKSTLIGRLLHDSKTIFEDQLAAVVKASRRYGDQAVNLALVTDGLRAEREQGITIDVAYRYFATPRRGFVLADTPGHVQYTRNMVTGASVADVAIVLVDARHGAVEQTRRHLAITAMLAIDHVVLAVNKMDLVEWSEERFDAIVAEVADLLDGAPAADDGRRPTLHPIPLSALHGDNVVERSTAAPWYHGPTLLTLLESLEIDERQPVAGPGASVRAGAGADADGGPDGPDGAVGARLPVQWVIRAGGDYRGYAGRLGGGPLAVGDAVVVLPSGLRSEVVGLTVAGTPARAAAPGDAVAVELADHLDVGRGDVIVADATGRPPDVAREVVTDVCWMLEHPLVAGQRVVVKHGARNLAATVTRIEHRLDPATLLATAAGADSLALNDLGRVTIAFAEPLVVDRYVDHPDLGRMILIDERSNLTAAAAIVREVAT